MKQHSTARWKRLVASFVAGTLALPLVPAHAVSTASPGYAGFVSQLPGVYATPPDVNVMFTLDDSGSMLSDAIPDIPSANMPADMPTNGQSNALNQNNGTFPGMWKRTWACVSYRSNGTCRTRDWVYSDYLSAALYSASSTTARFLRSAAGNPLYYDPKVTYLPWPKASDDQGLSANANPAAVNISPSDPFDTSYQLNLAVQFTDANGGTFWPATYFVYTGATPLKAGKVNDANNVSANFVRYEIKSTVTAYPRAATRTDCTGAVGAAGCTYAQELQNFANWLQYYHSRSLMAKGGVAAAFAKQGTNLRVGFGTINYPGSVRLGVRQFTRGSGGTGGNRQSFYDELYGANPSGSTPLRKAVQNVGQYFQRSDIGNPWAEDPTSTSTKGTEYACRRSFHILSTDGFWNGSGADSPVSDNNDAFSGVTPKKPDGTQYTFSNSTPPSQDALVGRFTIFPFSDTRSDTLADAAAYYWKTDLRDDLDNTVAPSSRDPAFWQHLTTFTIGLGITGSGSVKRTSDGSTAVPNTEPSTSPFYPYRGKEWLSDSQLRELLVANKTQLTWPTVNADSQQTGDDLIHAAMDSRGRYFSATNPSDLATGLAAALAEVADQPLDLSSLAADASVLKSGGRLYQATFNPNKWFGRLYAFRQDPVTGITNNKPSTDGSLNPDQLWEASLAMPAQAQRNIFTSAGSPNTGASFLWSDLTSTQKSALNSDPQILDYLRGDSSREVANGGTLRDRSRYSLGGRTGGVLGDIVNGSPIKGPDAGGGYDKLPTSDPGKEAYKTFRAPNALSNMRHTVFAAANDGMVHAFGVADGAELFAYVPNAVYNVPRSTSGGLAERKLLMLSDPAYTHRFTVDGPPNVTDGWFDDAWHSVLVGSEGAGARGIYAIDVTDTQVGPSGFGKSKVLWEFTEANHNDMGFVLGYPHVGRLRNGKWVVITGNGYDSKNGQAKLFLLDLKTGSVLKEFAVGTAGNNGLSQPNMILNKEREVISIYAGDLNGDLWKFDVSDTDDSKWAVAFGGQPLFSTYAIGAGKQPITVMPEISDAPSGPSGKDNAMIIFGTGKLFEATDTSSDPTKNVNLATQSLYGVWDKPGEATGITGAKATVLLKQEILPAAPGANFGSVTKNAPDWTQHRGWYIDLESGGERSNISPLQFGSVVFMVANKPEVNPCANGGQSKIFGLDPTTGGAPRFDVFASGNVRFDRSGVATQPLPQLSGSSGGADAPDVASFSRPVNDRGQLSGAREGGVSFEDNKLPNCKGVLSYARSDTGLDIQQATFCMGGKPRVSWRQLK